MCQSPSVSRVFSSRYSSVSTRLYPKISALFLLSNFPRAPEACPNSLKIRWKNGSVGNGSVKTAQLTAGCSVRTPANTVPSPSMAQSSTHMVLRAIELDRSVLDPTPLYISRCDVQITCWRVTRHFSIFRYIDQTSFMSQPVLLTMTASLR